MTDFKRKRDCQQLEENFARVMKSRQFIASAFSLYGGAAGFQTYGVLGKRVLDNVINVWRRMFVVDLCDPMDKTSMVYEIDSPIVTPYPVLKASGHVDRFTDPIVYDNQGRMERVDHYLKYIINHGAVFDEIERSSIMAQIEGGNLDDLAELMARFSQKSRGFGSIQTVNLMMSTHTSYAQNLSYLRPETAQGAFTEFKSLYSYNSETLPFGIVNIGKAYRKEVNPTPFTRLREFNQAELEYFYDPTNVISPVDLLAIIKQCDGLTSLLYLRFI